MSSKYRKGSCFFAYCPTVAPPKHGDGMFSITTTTTWEKRMPELGRRAGDREGLAVACGGGGEGAARCGGLDVGAAHAEIPRAHAPSTRIVRLTDRSFSL